jgi:hypothetical protein
MLTLTGAAFVHVALLLTHVLFHPFASVTFKLTVYSPGSSSFFVHVWFSPFALFVYVCNALHPQLFHSYIVYVKFHHHVSLPLNVYVITLLSTFGPSLLIFPVGNTLFHVAVAVAQLLPLHCASYPLYEYTFHVASAWASAVYVAFVSFVIAAVHALSLYHWYVHDVVSPGSLTFAVNTIALHSFPVLLTASLLVLHYSMLLLRSYILYLLLHLRLLLLRSMLRLLALLA